MVDNQFIASLLTRLLLVPASLRNALVLVEPEHFNGASEQHYALLWRAVREVMKTAGSLRYEDLRDMVLHIAAQTPAFAPVLLQELVDENPGRPGMLAWAFHYVQRSHLDPQVTSQMLQRFLQERHVFRPMNSAFAAAGGRMPDDMEKILSEAAARQRRVMEAGVNPISSALPAQWGVKVPKTTSTGLPFFDKWMDGGTRAGEANGLLGPTGVGKTTLGVNLIIGGCRVALTNGFGPSGRPPRAYVATYELSDLEMQQRLVSCAAEIIASSVEGLFENGPGVLSSAERRDYKPYELSRHARRYGENAGNVVLPGEFERLMADNFMFTDMIRILNLSGIGENARSGNGYVPELAALIEADQRDHGDPGVITVVVDHVLLASKRYMETKGMDPAKHTRHIVGDFSDQAKQQVCGRLETNAWLLHQLNNEGNKGSPTRVTSHTQAAEAGAFAHALSFVGCIGTKDKETNCCLLNFSKRRRAGVFVQPQIMHIRGEMAIIEDGNETHTIDNNNGRILRNRDARQFHGSVPTTPSASSAVGVVRNAVGGGAVL